VSLYSTWHLSPHIMYGILEVPPMLFHVTLSSIFQNSNRHVMYQDSVVIPHKVIIMIQVLYPIKSYGTESRNSVM